MNAPTHPSALRTGLALAFLAMSSVTGTAQIVQIKEVISREVSIHVGGVQDPEIREIVSREASLFVLSGPADPYAQVISREVSLANASLAPPMPVADFMVSPSPRGDRVDLDWRSYNGWAAGDILRFDIYWRDRPFTNVAGMTPLKSVSGESTSTTITGLPELRDHFFAVVPVDALTNFNSEVTYSAAYILSPEVISREVSIFVGDEPDPPYAQAISREVSFVVSTPEAPAAISNVVRQIAPDGHRVTLDWSAYNEWLQRDVARYDIYYSPRPFVGLAGLTRAATVSAGTFSFTFEGLPPWQDHAFAIVPVDAAGNSINDISSFGAYVLSPETISREVSLFVGDEPDPPYRQSISREVSFVVASTNVPAPVTGVDSGFAARKSETRRAAIDLDWTAYNEWAQRDVVRYRIYRGPTYFDFADDSLLVGYVADGTQRFTLDGLVGGDIYHVAVVAEDALGNFDPVVRSFSAQASDVSLEDPPRIALQPTPQSVVVGGSAVFMVASAGADPHSYQWHRDGLPLEGATSYELRLDPVSISDSGEYSVFISNPFGSAMSQPARLTVIQEPPRFTQVPPPAVAAIGGRVELSVQVEGTGPFNYQWRLNGQNLIGNPTSTQATLVIQPVRLADAGTYTAIVTGPGGTVTSDPVALTIDGLLSVAMSDSFATAAAISGAEGSVGTSNTGATSEAGEPRHANRPGGVSIWFRWTAPANGVVRLNTIGSGFDTLLAVYTGSSLSALTEVASDEDHGGFFTSDLQFNAVAGTSYAIAVDGLGGATGHVVLTWNLTPGAPVPRILQQPASVTTSAGSRVVLRIAATDATTYSWRRNGQPIAGATDPELVLDSLQLDDVGLYDVVVSGQGGTVLSAPAQVEIGPDPNVQSTDKLAALVAALRQGAPNPALQTSRRSARQQTAFSSAPIWTVSPGIPLSHAADNTWATTDLSEADTCSGPSTASLWFAVEVSQSGRLQVGASRGGFPVVLSLFDSSANNGLGEVMGCSTSNLLDVEVVAPGRHYFLLVDVLEEAHRGIIGIEVRLGSPPPPEIEPSWEEPMPGQTVVLNAPVTPLGPTARHQWFRNGEPLPGATAPQLRIQNAGIADQGVYSVRIDTDNAQLTYVVGHVALRLNPTLLKDSENGPRIEAGRFRFGLEGSPDHWMEVQQTTDLASWSTALEFWMPSTGRAMYEDDTATSANRYFRVGEIPLHILNEGAYSEGSQRREIWRVAGGRLGLSYVMETRQGADTPWTTWRTNSVQSSSYRFHLPQGMEVRVRPLGMNARP